MRIKINGREVNVDSETLTYEQIVAMVYPAGVTYYAKLEKDASRSGILHKGQKVDLVEGMHIDCCMTGNA